MSTSPKAQQPAAPGKPAAKLKPILFGRYLLLDRVAAGGMAEVWRAKQFGADDFQRIIAIKKILPHVVEDPEFIQMFKDEAKITVQLQHANIGQVYELNKVDDTFYIAMEYISGKDAKTLWSHQRQRSEPLPVPLCCAIVQKMSEGLDYAHRKRDNFGVELKIVHRDVSPQNILISWEGEVKVIDFGIAKAAGKGGRTQAGILKGKFGYMAPEQVRGMPIDQRADVFALGVCLYEFVTGERAFVADSDFSLLEMVRNVEVKPPSLANAAVPPEVERIIYKAMAKDPDDRYQWGSELAEDLQRFLLMNGRAPGRNDLADYLRQSFPGDYDRERLRMESYRDLELPEMPAAPAPQPARPQAPAFDPSQAAVAAALLEDDVVAASQPMSDPGMPPAHNTNPRANISGPGNPTRGNTQTAIRPPAVAAPPPPPPMVLPVEEKGGMGKIIAGALAAVVLVVAVAAGVAMFFKGKGTMVLGTSPDGAEVQVDGQLRGVTKDGELTIPDVGTGQHLVKVSKEKYQPVTMTVTLARNQIFRETIKLERQPDPTGLMAIKSRPGGAAIWLDGADTGKVTPVELEIPVGEHSVQLRLQSYKKKEIRVTMEQDAKGNQEVTLKPSKVQMEVSSQPPGAKVYDETKQLLGTTPFVYKDLGVDPPFPLVVIKRTGCKDLTTTLVPDEDGDATQEKTLALKCK